MQMRSWTPRLFDFTAILCIVANVVFCCLFRLYHALRVCEAFQVRKSPDIAKCCDLLVWGFQQVCGMTLGYCWCEAGANNPCQALLVMLK